jgi:hypothetical protein
MKAVLRALLGRVIRGELIWLKVEFAGPDGGVQTAVAGRFPGAVPVVIPICRPK